MRGVRKPDPCIVVIFGASGDLTSRKLLPALYNLQREGLVPDNVAIVGNSRTKFSDEDFAAKMRDAVEEHSRSKPTNDSWSGFGDRIFYVPGDVTDESLFSVLRSMLEEIDVKLG
nr:glucose-6-phosphate dehydrogenase [Actinomycetota bacterium]